MTTEQIKNHLLKLHKEEDEINKLISFEGKKIKTAKIIKAKLGKRVSHNMKAGTV